MENSVKIGDYNKLTVTKVVNFGVYLDGGDEENNGWGEILLPARYVPADCEVGQELQVFVYFDSEDRIIATTETPKAKVGEFAYLRVTDVNDAGAFLDWGLAKDVLVPYNQQANRMRKGAFCLVYLYQDEESERVTASSKVSRFLNKQPPEYKVGDVVDGLVMAQTDLGYKVIINHCHTGMLYHNEIFASLKIGQRVSVQVKKIRDDEKIDLKLQTVSKNNLSELEQTILDKLARNHGLLRVGDKTPPAEIYQLFGVSKKNFKRAVSHLYKQRLIVVKADSIALANS